jgi:hypothetical protein
MGYRDAWGGFSDGTESLAFPKVHYTGGCPCTAAGPPAWVRGELEGSVIIAVAALRDESRPWYSPAQSREGPGIESLLPLAVSPLLENW